MSVKLARGNKLENKSLATTNQKLAIREGVATQADYVPHWNLETVKLIAENTTNERDALLIQTIFDGCFRVGEALAISPQDIVTTGAGWLVRLESEKHNGEHTTAAISASIAAKLQAYAYRHSIKPDEPIFPIKRSRVFQIVEAAVNKAGVVKPAGVGMVHVLRHSGAIERLRVTGNPKAVQDQLRHKSAQMTLRYMKTLSHDASMVIQQGVDFRW